ncbi:hypothetical protein P7K49_012521 [Saguinus oedipus]|uniref:Uncharacterized protein n=1 Tax=Saguinus oedipus TaxID=9490 RepID=A0ABQ9VTR5_SAGOE|nr:hypothetical protein P7K49_012521 [Saguinus oedipus]
MGKFSGAGTVCSGHRETETQLLKALPLPFGIASRDSLGAPAAPLQPRPANHVHPQQSGELRARRLPCLPPGPGPPGPPGPLWAARGAGPAARPETGFGGGPREPFAGERGASGSEAVSVLTTCLGAGARAANVLTGTFTVLEFETTGISTEWKSSLALMKAFVPLLINWVGWFAVL